MTEKSILEHFDAPESTVRHIDPAANDEPTKVIVIGNGPVGVRFTQEILKRRPTISLRLFGNEASQPYNRVQLSALLAGDIQYEDIITRLPSEEKHPGFSAYWRAAHVILGMVCAAVLIAHTGLNLGDNLNRYLMLNFLAVLFMGAVAGLVISNSHVFSTARAMELRTLCNWVHLLVAWPLPILLGMHILTVYYF